MTPPQTVLTVSIQDVAQEVERLVDQTAEIARQNERGAIIALLQSEDGWKAISDGPLATSYVIQRVVKLVTEGAWKS